jgi:hypothetical protein
MDEARHCETFDKLLRDKMGMEPRPITRPLDELLGQTLVRPLSEDEAIRAVDVSAAVTDGVAEAASTTAS